MSTITYLLDEAKKKTGSDSETGRRVGVSPQRVNDWRHDRKPAAPEDYALVAAIAGLDANEALVRALLERHANTAKGEALLSALGKWLRPTGAAATLLGFVSGALIWTSAMLQPTPAMAGVDNVQ